MREIWIKLSMKYTMKSAQKWWKIVLWKLLFTLDVLLSFAFKELSKETDKDKKVFLLLTLKKFMSSMSNG